jgi:hypothetical protein
MLNTGRTYGSKADTVKVMKFDKRGKHLNTLERYHIHKRSKEGLQMNDAHIHTHYPIFEALQETDTRQKFTYTEKTTTQSSLANSYSHTSQNK